MPPHDAPSADAGEALSHSLVAGVLARLPEADRRRALTRRGQIRQRLGAALLSGVLLVGCFGPRTSNVATHSLAFLLAAADAWQTLVRVLLGGAIVLPLISTLCLVGLSLVLWEQFLHMRGHGLR